MRTIYTGGVGAAGVSGGASGVEGGSRDSRASQLFAQYNLCAPITVFKVANLQVDGVL